ncbi:regulator [Streptomyces sp. NBC_00102]|uniref:regulator n=1 Tax=Streptomyces sp. NBC_00102 TaxID=2975652 RepID=UPI00224EABF0|nr:regulator [Streptomyces sp. NBC_00102]MCX5395611.1 regulator [Streptomyces sp. NBC_00102]
MSTPLISDEAQRTVDLLASRPLVRLVTEIDDNGAIPPRRMTATLTDLSTHHLRSASDTARAYGLIRIAPGAGLELTQAGLELVDLYDAMAHWARGHAVPAPVCAFTSRIRAVLGLLAPSLATGAHVAGADEGLARLRSLLIQWLADNPQVARAAEPEQAA